MSWKLFSVLIVLVLINGAGLVICIDAIAKIKVKMDEIERRFDKFDKKQKM